MRYKHCAYICRNKNEKVKDMKNFNTKQELRNEVMNSSRIKITFDCGLELFKQNCENEIIMTRDHEYKFISYRYETEEQFITAVWSKLKRGGQVTELSIR